MHPKDTDVFSDGAAPQEIAVLRAENAELKRSLQTSLKNHFALERELTTVLETMGSAFFFMDRDFKILRVNSLHEKAVRMRRADILGKSFWDLHFSDPATHESLYWINYHKAMRDRCPVSFIDYYEGLDIWTDVNAFPTPDGGLAVFYYDITSEKKSALDAAASKHKFEAIFEGSATPLVFFRGPDLIYEIYNSKYQELLPRRDLLGKPLLEALPEVISTAFPTVFKQVFETGKPEILHEESATITNPNTGEAEHRFFDNTISRINDGMGKPFGVFVQALEVTDRVKARKRLEVALAAATDANNEIDEVIEGMSDAFFTLDAKWKILRVNAQFEKVVRSRREDVLGKSLLELYFKTPEQKESLYVKTYSKVMAERTPGFFVDYYEPLNIWTSVSVYPMSSGGIAIFFKEITEERRSAQKLQEAIVARDRFLSIASHELRTPITSMKLQVQMMERGLKKEDPSILTRERIAKLVSQTGRGLDRMNRLVEDMLDISRIEGGKLHLNFRVINFLSLIHEVIERFSEQLEAAGISWSVNSDVAEVLLPVDSFRIEQVLTNLITNSIRYAPHSPISLTIDSSDRQCVTLVFQDRGPGIARENQERVFERFERLVSANEVSGLGLGLFIVREIVQAHGGFIHLEPTTDPGARFVIRLPKTRDGHNAG